MNWKTVIWRVKLPIPLQNFNKTYKKSLEAYSRSIVLVGHIEGKSLNIESCVQTANKYIINLNAVCLLENLIPVDLSLTPASRTVPNIKVNTAFKHQ